MAKRKWRAVRQQSGQMVKEFREQRPWYSASDTREVREEKDKIEKARRAVTNRKSVDRVELFLALFGWTGYNYTLTYDDEHLPSKFAGVQRNLRAFIKRARRHLQGRPFDYVYCIEGRHGDHRYHIHIVLSDKDFSIDDVTAFWKKGHVKVTPVLRESDKLGYRTIAKYFVKERADGKKIPINRHPWVVSQSLRDRLPPAETWLADSGNIDIPDNLAFPETQGGYNSPFGSFNYATYILKDS